MIQVIVCFEQAWYKMLGGCIYVGMCVCVCVYLVPSIPVLCIDMLSYILLM
jgi:hypothetical protein